MLMKQQAISYWEDLTTTFGESWNAFWFTPASSQPLAIVRIGTGLLATIHFLSYWADLTRWFAPNGLLPAETVRRLTEEDGVINYNFTLLQMVTKPNEIWVFEIIAIVASLLLAIGLFSRVSAAVSLIMLLSFVHRAPMISGFGEPILSMLLFYLCLAPSGEWLSVNAWWKGRKQTDHGTAEVPAPSVLANIGIRLIQVHLAAFIFMMGLSKLSAEPWWTGDAVWYMIAQTTSRPVDLSSLRASPFVINAWTHALLAFEFAFPILIWNRFARPLLLGIGVALWLSLALVSGHLIFCLTLIVAAAAFWPWNLQPAPRTA
ncbi:hypothetical protein ETAA8_14870 [Anatilimnocola aggregata]|uniref:HTTM-like domain-containing protein n=1 Tax=Anatilimnocola aggregata TaxID=2528021 RepID=A0A517Y837_9BACT|nr:hypothetical protein [Anatilimnocola aggregata]QDU26409.1 hypothetical protein ETAA8_14870 [Anatilimnocola aggregata]